MMPQAEYMMAGPPQSAGYYYQMNQPPMQLPPLNQMGQPPPPHPHGQGTGFMLHGQPQSLPAGHQPNLYQNGQNFYGADQYRGYPPNQGYGKSIFFLIIFRKVDVKSASAKSKEMLPFLYIQAQISSLWWEPSKCTSQTHFVLPFFFLFSSHSIRFYISFYPYQPNLIRFLCVFYQAILFSIFLNLQSPKRMQS